MLKNAFEEWCARTGRTRPDAARELGVTTRAIGQWLDGKRRPRPPHMKALADMLGLDPVAVLDQFRKGAA